MKYFFLFLTVLLIVLSSCVSLPNDELPDIECNVDSDCEDFSGARICNAEGTCETCPDPQCVELPSNCIYIPDDTTRCPGCGTVDCIDTIPPPDPVILPSLDRGLAFPRAEGFGARTRGAYALYEKTGNPEDLPEIYHVTSLSGGSGEGTLGKVMRMEDPRLVVFDVGGTIELSKNIPSKNPYITIAGQTAPGEGIMIKNGALTFHDSEVIVRGLRIMNGDDTNVQFSPSNRDAISVWGNSGSKPTNIILDHNTFMWASDETVSIGLDVRNVTVQYNIIAEGLENSHHPEGPHGKGLMIATYSDYSDYFSVHHNIIAFNTDRNPLLSGYGNGIMLDPSHNEVINNYMYHIKRGSIIRADAHFIGNYHDNTNTAESHTLNLHTNDKRMGELEFYLEDNYGPTRKDSTQPEWDIVRKTATGVLPNQVFEYIFEPSGIQHINQAR